MDELTTQQMFEEALGKIAERHGLRLAIDRMCVNNGHYAFFREEGERGLDEVLRFPFVWYQDYGSFDNGKRPHPLSGTVADCERSGYERVEYTALADLLDAVESKLPEAPDRPQ